MIKLLRKAFCGLGVMLALGSCNFKEANFDTENTFRGVFVMNKAGSVSFYDPIADILTNNLFRVVNDRPLGGDIISSSFSSNLAYILVQEGSQDIEKVNIDDFKEIERVTPNIGNLTDLISVSDTFVYLTSGASGADESGELYKLNAETLDVIGGTTIKVGKYPTKMAYESGKLLYVANTEDDENGIMVVDIVNNSTIDTVKIEGAIADGSDNPTTIKSLTRPVDLIIDIYNNLWVLCEGTGAGDAGLARISYVHHEVSIFPLTGIVGGRDCLSRSPAGATIYFVNEGTKSISYNEDNYNDIDFAFGEDRYKNVAYDALSVDPTNAKFYCSSADTDQIIIFDAFGFNEDNNLIEVGENPGKCIFKK